VPVSGADGFGADEFSGGEFSAGEFSGGEFKEIPESIFSDDDGSADAHLAQALIRYSSGRIPLTEVVDALGFARVLVPVIASGELRHVGSHGFEQDSIASTGVVAVRLADGRAALPIFTDVDAMRAWKPEARPVPAEGPRAALAAVSENWSALVLNPGMEAVVIPRPAVWALAQGQEWRPAVLDGLLDPEVRDALIAAVSVDGDVRRVDARAGAAAEVALVLSLEPGLGSADLEAVIARVEGEIASAAVLAQRIDSLEITVVSAHQD
jgi:hypothetical protein